MQLPLRQLHFWTLLLLVISTNLLFEKVASIPECHNGEGNCTTPLVKSFNTAITLAETYRDVSEETYKEFFFSEYFATHFWNIHLKILKKNYEGFITRAHCHSTITNPPHRRTENKNIKNKKYLEMLINFVGAWTNPLFHLLIELNAMQEVPETILSSAKKMEMGNREILEELKFIHKTEYPTENIMEMIPSWPDLPNLRSSDIDRRYSAIFNLYNCIYRDSYFLVFHLNKLRCRITNEYC